MAKHSIGSSIETNGNGGELHQEAGADHPVFTTNQGIPVTGRGRRGYQRQDAFIAAAKTPPMGQGRVRSNFSITASSEELGRG